MLDDELDQRVIERRIAAVSAVRQVVHAIWALSRAQLPLAETAAARATAYLAWVDDVVSRLAGSPKPLPEQDTLVVVLGPERAYCGALPRRVAAAIPKVGPIALVGQRLIEAASGLPGLDERVLFALGGANSHDEHERVGRAVAKAVMQHAGRDSVELLYPTAHAMERAVLLAGPREAVLVPPETYSPLPVVVQTALTELVSSRLTVAVAETLRAEVLARIAAAERAKTGCDHKLEQLEQGWRVARQERITNELLEVVAGRQAALAAEVR